MIKYIDKIENLENKIFYSYDFEIAFTSLEGLINLIKSNTGYEANKEISYVFKIAIVNTENSSMVLEDEISKIGRETVLNIYEVKTMLSNIAYKRVIGISSNLDEIYSESIDVSVDSDNTGWYSFSFDYGLMYGNYDIYEKNDFIEIKYPNSGEINNFIINDAVLPNKSIKAENLNEEISCIYYGDLYSSNDEYLSSVDSIDIIPVSIFSNKLGRTLNNNVYTVYTKFIDNDDNTINISSINIHADNKNNAIKKIEEKIGESKIEIPCYCKDIYIKSVNMDYDNDETEWIKY